MHAIIELMPVNHNSLSKQQPVHTGSQTVTQSKVLLAKETRQNAEFALQPSSITRKNELVNISPWLKLLDFICHKGEWPCSALRRFPYIPCARFLCDISSDTTVIHQWKVNIVVTVTHVSEQFFRLTQTVCAEVPFSFRVFPNHSIALKDL